MSIFNKNKLNKIVKKDENWVAKILKRRTMKPYYIVALIVLLIIIYAVFTAYLDAKEYSDKNEQINKKINRTNKQINNINNKINNIKKEINYINGTSLDSKGAIKIMTRVCEMLKSKDTIGSFYIKKKTNNKYNNVQNFEIQISYGDKDLLMLISKMVLEKVFYLKNIEQTKNGIAFELFKPSEKGNNEK